MENTRKIGKKVLCFIWEKICDLLEFVLYIYQVALNKQKAKTSLTILCCVVTIILTSATLVLAMKDTFMGSGVMYFTASVPKHIAIHWSNESGWNHTTQELFNFFEGAKEDLILNDTWAQALNELAAMGMPYKAFQVFLLILCIFGLFFLVSLILGSIHTLIKNIRKSINKIIGNTETNKNEEIEHVKPLKTNNKKTGARRFAI